MRDAAASEWVAPDACQVAKARRARPGPESIMARDGHILVVGAEASARSMARTGRR